MADLIIKLTSDLCASNGESIGFGIDTDICTDTYGFPYIPGRRILGCLRNTAEELKAYGACVDNMPVTSDDIIAIFGNGEGQEGILTVHNAYLPEIEKTHRYIDSLEDDFMLEQVTKEKISRLYTTVRGQTKIGDDGRASEGSLRAIRVVNQYDPFTNKPLEFKCNVDGGKLNKRQEQLLEMSCKALRHIGLNRNRGLGNISITLDWDSRGSSGLDKVIIDESKLSDGKDTDPICVEYKVFLESPITLQEYMESGRQIKARSVIGAWSKVYLEKHHKVDANFQKLFVDGTVRWSPLTPIISPSTSENGGCVSYPIPAMMMRLKNDNNKIVNTFACEDKEWKKKKPKELDGYYAAKINGTYYVAEPISATSYHNRINGIKSSDEGGLYMQESISQGVLYGGTVLLPADSVGTLFETLKGLFSVGRMRFGRSKKTQYGAVRLVKPVAERYHPSELHVEDGEPIFAILKSDLILQQNAVYDVRDDAVREAIISHLNRDKNCISSTDSWMNEYPDGFHDICRYHVISGFHAMWQMQKPKIMAAMGGNIYCFRGRKGDYVSKFTIGEYQQEGFGVIELVTLEQLRSWGKITKGKISRDIDNNDISAPKAFQDLMLYKSAKMAMEEYASRYDGLSVTERIPVSRLRQMLHDADSFDEFKNMIDGMSTSDVDSKNRGKKQISDDLIKAFYGSQGSVDLSKIIEDEMLLDAIQNNYEVKEKITSDWKEPLYALLRILHYRKGGAE